MRTLPPTDSQVPTCRIRRRSTTNAKSPDVAVEAQFSHRAAAKCSLATPAGIEPALPA
jgi:hypothetical protein